MLRLNFYVSWLHKYDHRLINKDIKLYAIESSSKIHTNDINGASNIALIQDENSKVKRYVPKVWVDGHAKPEDKWLYLQEKKIKENILKSSIANNASNIQDYFQQFEPFLI